MPSDPLVVSEDRLLREALIDEVGFGLVFTQSAGGARVANDPLVSTGNGALRLQLARSNALAAHPTGHHALAVIPL